MSTTYTHNYVLGVSIAEELVPYAQSGGFSVWYENGDYCVCIWRSPDFDATGVFKPYWPSLEDLSPYAKKKAMELKAWLRQQGKAERLEQLIVFSAY